MRRLYRQQDQGLRQTSLQPLGPATPAPAPEAATVPNHALVILLHLATTAPRTACTTSKNVSCPGIRWVCRLAPSRSSHVCNAPATCSAAPTNAESARKEKRFAAPAVASSLNKNAIPSPVSANAWTEQKSVALERRVARKINLYAIVLVMHVSQRVAIPPWRGTVIRIVSRPSLGAGQFRFQVLQTEN